MNNSKDFEHSTGEQVPDAENVHAGGKITGLQAGKPDEEEENSLQQEDNHLDSLILKNEMMLKAKKEQLSVIKEEHERLNNEVEKLECEVAILEKELEKAKRRLQDKQNLYEVDKLEKELQVLQGKEREMLRDAFQKCLEENTIEECGKKMHEEISQCSYYYMKQMKEFENFLKDMENSKVKPRRQRLKNMGECLARLREECDELQRTNERLEEEIKSMESGKGVCTL